MAPPLCSAPTLCCSLLDTTSPDSEHSHTHIRTAQNKATSGQIRTRLGPSPSSILVTCLWDLSQGGFDPFRGKLTDDSQDNVGLRGDHVKLNSCVILIGLSCPWRFIEIQSASSPPLSQNALRSLTVFPRHLADRASQTKVIILSKGL